MLLPEHFQANYLASRGLNFLPCKMDIPVFPYKGRCKCLNDIIHGKSQPRAGHLELNKLAVINYYFSHTEGQRKDSVHRLKN